MEDKGAAAVTQPFTHRIGAKQVPAWVYHSISVSTVVLVVALTVLVILFRQQLLEFRNYGYVGVFVINVVASASFVAPVPALAVVFALGGILNPLLVGIVSGIGSTLGEVTGYLLGYGGREVMEHVRFYHRMEDWMEKRGWLLILVLAFIPNPLFDIAGAAAGALRYPLWKFFLYGAIGKTGKALIFAYGGLLGLPWVIEHL